MRIAIVLLLAATLPLQSGCRGVSPVTPSRKPVSVALEPVSRQVATPDSSMLPVIIRTGAELPPLGNYRGLAAEDCCSLACQNSALGNLIESGVTRKTGPLSRIGKSEAADRVRITTAQHLSQEARNRTAGTALNIYYKLLEAELKSDLLVKALAELDELITVNNKLALRGFKQSTDAHELQKQRVELLSQQARLRAGILKGNAELKSLLGIDPNSPDLLLPIDKFQVTPDPLNVEQTVQLGLALRADLNLIRTLTTQIDHRTLVAVRHAMIGISPALSAVQSASEVLFPPLTMVVTAVAKAEAAVVKRQLQGLLLDREREATKDIRSAIDEWEASRQLIVIARQRVELCRNQVIELEKKSNAGMGVEAELRKARLEALKAEEELVTEVIRWKLADVKVREEIGLLCNCRDQTCPDAEPACPTNAAPAASTASPAPPRDGSPQAAPAESTAHLPGNGKPVSTHQESRTEATKSQAIRPQSGGPNMIRHVSHFETRMPEPSGPVSELARQMYSQAWYTFDPPVR